MRLGIVGAGAVGAATARSLVQPAGTDARIVVVDRDAARARGLAEDVGYAAAALSGAAVTAGEYDDLAGADIVVVTAGVNEKAGGATDRNDAAGRRRLIPANARVMAEVIPAVAAAAPRAVTLVVTDPPDPLAELASRLAPGLAIVSAGTVIDSLRFRVRVAHELGVRPGDVDAQVVGEHGTSAVHLWSSATVGGVPVLDLLAERGDVAAIRRRVESEVAFGNISVIEGTGASQHAIGAVAGRIVEAIARDERAVLPVAGHVAEFGTTIALPTVVGARGALRTLLPAMDAEERARLDRSAEVLRDAAAQALQAAA